MAGLAMSLRLAFMGTPDFAVPGLAALLAAGHEIAAVYCQPPRPSGRGHRTQPSPVQEFAASRGLAVRHPVSLRTPEAEAEFAALALDAAVVAAYGLILPKAILAAPRLGCINIHASLLPRWRGAAPIQRAILAGDSVTGITIMQMDEGLDTGAILLAESVPIGAATTAGELHDDLAARGGRLAVAALASIADGTLRARRQPQAGITYAAKLRRDEGRLDWRRPAIELERAVRALNPWPGTWLEFAGERIKVVRAESAAAPPVAPPGTVLDARLGIACGDGVFRPTVLQRPGRAAADTASVLRGFPIAPGQILPCPATS
jgi:methionyl-tRNA formyltransferase